MTEEYLAENWVAEYVEQSVEVVRKSNLKAYRNLKNAFLAGLKGRQELEEENKQLKQQIKMMENCWNCEHYNTGSTTCLKGKPHNSGGCLKDWVFRNDRRKM